MLDAIAQFIAANVPGVVYAEDGTATIFVDHLPQEPDRCVAVLSMQAEAPDSKLPYDPFGFTVIVRSEQGGVWARDTSEAIYNLLHGVRNRMLFGRYAVFILATTASPFPLGPDENARPRLTTDYRSEVLNPTGRPARPG